jgi:CzcA family heavy metal efflux pump
LFIEAQGQALSPAAIASTIVRQNGLRRVTLADVATVEFGAEPKFGDTLIQGRPGVLITMMSQYGSNTMDATRAVESTLDELSATIERAGVKVHGRLHRPATFIENALENIRRSLWVGAALVAVILILFLNDVRAAVISLAAIPLSLLVAVLVMNACGATLNTMSLGGLAMALGEVVDDAIIDVENILRRLRQRMQSGSKSSIVRTVLDASLEVRGSVVYATIVVALVFLPVIFLSGLEGKLFAPLGIAYVLATGASLLVALTITPALSMLWLPRGTSERREPRLQRALRSIYQKALRAVFRARWFALAMVVVLLAVTGALVTRLGGEFLPPFREGHFVLHVSEAPGASLEEMSRIGRNISAALLEIAGVDTVEQQIGRAELGEDPFAPNRSEFHVELKRVSPSDEERIEGEIRRVLQAVPGIRFDIMTFLGDRISETITGETAPVVIRLFGDDLDELDRTASRIADVATGVAGAVDIQPSAFQGWPQTTIRLKRDRIQQLGFRPGDVLRGVQAALQGVVAAQVHDAARTLDVVVFSGRGSREGPESIGGLMLQNEAGLQAPLAELAEVKFEEGRARVRHWGGRRWQSITCNVEGRDTDSVVADLRARIGREVRFPSNSFFDIAGTSEARARGEYQLLRNGAAAGAGILLILALAFGSARNLALVLLNLPFALVGGVFALAWTNHSLSMGSLVGFVTLFGISTRNSIMLVSHFQHLVGVEGAAWNVDTAIRGASERVIPILMTALVTGIGLLPIAAGSGDAGREVEGPMAIVIVGGLVTSTLLNLFVLPVLCERFGRFPVMNPAGALAP